MCQIHAIFNGFLFTDSYEERNNSSTFASCSSTLPFRDLCFSDLSFRFAFAFNASEISLIKLQKGLALAQKVIPLVHLHDTGLCCLKKKKECNKQKHNSLSRCSPSYPTEIESSSQQPLPPNFLLPTLTRHALSGSVV